MRPRPGLRLLTMAAALLVGSVGLVPAVLATPTAEAATSTQVIAAGTSTTNLATESVYPGAQNPPYICCWSAQGQFVTFSFSVAAGQTGLALRYSAGAGTATRKVELDGAVLVANQSFAGTGSWSTWASVSLSQSLTAGTHSLKVWYDATAGSSRYLNLDNLTVTSQSPPPPPTAPTNTAAPTISGVAQVPNTLTASTGSWTGSPTSFSYQWSRCNGSCSPVVDPNNTYALTSADVGSTIVVAVTASNAAGPSSPASSGPTAVVAAASSKVVIGAGQSTTNLPTENKFTGAQNPPYICCWSAQGQFVTFTFNTAANGFTFVLRYSAAWGQASRKVELDGSVLAANQAFPSTGDWNVWSTVTLGANLTAGSHSLKVWFDGPAGSAGYLNLDNLTVSPGSPPPPAAPTNTAPPAISGTAQVGNTLTASTGTWTGSPTSFSYQWSRCNGSCTAVANPGASYALTGADQGSTIVVAVTATNGTGPSSPASSTPTAVVAAASANVVIGAGQSATNLPTENKFTGAQNPPYICCWNQQGQFVTFTFNTAAGPSTFVLRYAAALGQATRKIELDGAVLVANQAFPGTADWNTWSTVTLGSTLAAGSHSLKVWFDAPAGSQQWLNLDNLTVSAGAAPKPTNTAVPTISGTAMVGSTLTASTGTWTGSPSSFSYQWSRCNGSCTAITNAGSTYVLGGADVGSTIIVAVTATNGSGASAPATSAPTQTVVASSPGTVAVALGYADSTAGLTPWSGSPNTIYIGTTAQCCSTHGPNNGGNTYDGGAMEVTNTSASSVVVNALTVDLPTQSGPVTFSLWGGGGANRLPQTLAPGAHLVLTATGFFNFDSSDGYGEACHFNTGGTPVVHLTVNGALTDYQDTHQILNADGNDKASCPGDVSEEVPFTSVTPGVQPAAAPVNDVRPALTGTPVVGRIMSGIPGAWNASPPPALVGVWLQCDSSGNTCNPIAGSGSQTYRPVPGDVGHTLRYQVTGSNGSGNLAVASVASAVVQAGPAVAQIGNTSTGFTSIFVTNGAGELSSTFTAASSGTTTDFTFYVRGAGNNQSFTPKIYSVVNGSKGALLGTGAAVTVPKATDGRWYVSNLPGVALTGGAQYVLALVPSATFNGSYLGSENNGQLSVFADYAP
ncbi:MAG: hypothetical protein JWL73_2306 [Actinomycetia bacterium]|nr:hypothetical protein [Actinomycetes bacterium]